jgi:hypothetical protein
MAPGRSATVVTVIGASYALDRNRATPFSTSIQAFVAHHESDRLQPGWTRTSLSAGWGAQADDLLSMTPRQSWQTLGDCGRKQHASRHLPIRIDRPFFDDQAGVLPRKSLGQRGR